MKIIEKTVLVEQIGLRITSLEVTCPHVAAKAQAGQFVVVMVKKEGERIPLTIVEKTKDSITLIFQEVGLTTKLLGSLAVGDSLYAVVGPLGKPTEVKKYGNVILIGGGVGIAEIYPVAKALQQLDNKLTVILGARTKNALILEKELRDVSGRVWVATDDGSYGKKGFVTGVLEELLEEQKYDLVYCVGPLAMMKKVAMITEPYKLATVVSLNAVMIDATGMCGCCRVTVAGKMKFSCVDGPEFAADQIDWDELEKRNSLYKDKEEHICNLFNLVQ